MSIRAKTKRRLLILTGGSAAVLAMLVGLYLYRMTQIEQEMAEHLELGMEAMEAEDYPTALDHLREYRRRNRDDVEVAYQLATAAQQVERPQGRHLSEAIAIYQDLLERDPSHEQAQRELLELYVQVRFDVEAIELADRLLQRFPDDAEIMRHKVTSLIRLRRLDEALELAEQAVELEPTHLPTHERVLEILRRLDRPGEDLVAWAQQYHEQYPEDPQFEALLGFAYGVTRDSEQAVEWINRAADREVEDPQLIRRLVTLLSGAGAFDDALALLERSVERVEDEELRRMLARWMWEANRYDDLLALLEELDADAPQTDSELLALKAGAMFRQGDREGAEQLVAALEERRGDNTARAWAPVLAQVIGAETQDPREVVEVCEESIEAQPSIPYVRAYLAEAQARIGETELAVEQWENASQLSQTWATPHIRLAQTYNATGRSREALSHVQAALRRSPESLTAAVTLSEVLASLLAEGETTDENVRVLVDLLERIQGSRPGEQRTLPTYVNVLAGRGEQERAVEAIERALSEEQTLGEDTLLRLAEVSRQRELGMTDRLLDASEEAHGMTPGLAYARAVTRFMAGEREEARQQFRQQLHEQEGQSVPWELAYARFLDVTRHEEAAPAWRRLAEEHPDNINLQREVLSARSVQDDRQLLDEVIERVRELGGEQGLTWRVARARWLLDAEDDGTAVGEAIELLEEVIRSSPDLVEPRLLLAQAMRQAGDDDGAVEQLVLARSMQPNDMEIVLELAELRLERSEHDEARQLVDSVLNSSQSEPAQRQTAADILAKLGESEEAIALLSSDGSAGGASSSLLLAELHLRRNEREQAVAIYERLMEEQPNASVIQAYSNYLGAHGRTEEAGEVLAVAEEIGLEDQVVAMLYAEYTRRYGSAGRTVEYYRDAIEADDSNASVWRRLIDFHLDRGEIDEALAVCDEARDAAPDNRGFAMLARRAEVIRVASTSEQVRPVVRAILHDEEHRDAAMQTLEILSDAQEQEREFAEVAEDVRDLANSYPRFFELQNLAVDLYVSANTPSPAILIAERAMQNFPNQPEPARRAAQLLAGEQQWDRMLYVAREWRERELYNPVQADIAIAEAQLNLDNPRAAVQQVERYMERARQEPNRAFPILSVYVRSMATLGRVEQAAEAIEPLLDQDDAWRNLWVNVAVRQIDDPATAADWLDRVESFIPQQNVSERAALASHWHRLGRRLDDADHRRRALALLKDLAEREDASATAVLTYAVTSYQEGDLETAEAQYRRALELNDEHPVALNNLAMLLAEQKADLNEALELAERAVRQRPNVASYYDTLAFVQMQREAYEEAVGHLERAVELEPEDVSWRVNLAMALHRQGDREQAQQTLQDLESQNPNLDLEGLPPTVRTRLEQLREELAEARAAAP